VIVESAGAKDQKSSSTLVTGSLKTISKKFAVNSETPLASGKGSGFGGP